MQDKLEEPREGPEVNIHLDLLRVTLKKIPNKKITGHDCIQGAYNKFPDFFLYGHFYWQYSHETLVPFEVISSSCNALVVLFQQLLEGSMEFLLCEQVNDLYHSLFHLLNSLIMTASELRE